MRVWVGCEDARMGKEKEWPGKGLEQPSRNLTDLKRRGDQKARRRKCRSGFMPRS